MRNGEYLAGAEELATEVGAVNTLDGVVLYNKEGAMVIPIEQIDNLIKKLNGISANNRALCVLGKYERKFNVDTINNYRKFAKEINGVKIS